MFNRVHNLQLLNKESNFFPNIDALVFQYIFFKSKKFFIQKFRTEDVVRSFFRNNKIDALLPII